MDYSSENTADLVRCSVCHSTNLSRGELILCRRCGQAIYHYKSPKLDTSWALLIAAMIAYLPANLYPMLITDQFGNQAGSTIVEGILLLWDQGAYPIALVVFFASVFVPILKFAVLGYLLLSVQYPLGRNKKINKHKMHMIAEIIGPWSMIDIFVVAILASLINLVNVQIVPGPAATAFAISVLLTLFATRAFDTRLFKES